MPAQCLTPHRPMDAFHRVMHATPQTTDVGFHYVPDAIAEAERAHSTPNMGLTSNNVKRAYNGRKAAKAQLGVSGGYVETADRNMPVNGGDADFKATVKARRNVKAGQRSAKRAAQSAKRAYVLAELRQRGYTV